MENVIRSRAAILVALLTGVSLVSCGADAGSPSTSTTSADAIPEVSLVSNSVVAYDDRLLAEFELLKEPDELIFLDDLVWTKTADGHLVAIDPTANSVVADVDVDTTTDPYHYCQGLGTDGTGVWACSASGDPDHETIDVVRFDPITNSVAATFAVNKVFEQFDFPLLDGRMWVLSELGSELVGIDVETDQLSEPISLGVRCFQLAVVGGELLATCALDDLVLRIDVERGEIVDQVSLSSPRNVIANGDEAWVLLDNAIVRLDPDTLDPVVMITGLPGVGFTGDALLTDDAMWIRQKEAFLYGVDLGTLAVIEQISPEEPLAGGSVIIAFDSIWVTANDDNLLARLSLAP